MNTLKDLAELAGISSSYVDKTGKTQVTNDEVRKFFLKAMKIKAESQTDIDESVKELTQKVINDNYRKISRILC